MKLTIVSRVVARWLLALLVLGFGNRGFGVEWEPDNAYERLLSAKIFAFGGVGIAGVTSDGEKAFHVVLARTNRLDLLKAVLKEGTRAGQMYALCGLRKAAPDDFRVEAQRFASEKERCGRCPVAWCSRRRFPKLWSESAPGSTMLTSSAVKRADQKKDRRDKASQQPRLDTQTRNKIEKSKIHRS